jgi:hypothetical protein
LELVLAQLLLELESVLALQLELGPELIHRQYLLH